jgi:hypothetical protein
MNPPEPTTTSVFKTRGPLDPVTDSAICVARPELDYLLRAAHAPTVDAYLAVLGSRQTGKTTLLYQLRARLRPRGLGIALVDLAGVSDQPEDRLYGFVASQIRSELDPNLSRRAPRGEASAQPKRDTLAMPTSPLEFRRFLLDVARQVHAPRVILLLDEVEAVPEKYSDAFFGTFRNIFSSRRKEDEAVFEKYLIVLCGATELHRLTTGPNSPLNIAERIYLQDLSLEGVRTLTANFARAGITAPPETAQWLYDQASGYPYLTQKLCAVIEQHHPPAITQESVQRAATEVLRTDDHLAKMILQIEAEPPARDLLRQIVAGETVPFSRLKPVVARLELLGVIRDAGHCAVRNAIYRAAFQTHFNLPAAVPQKRIQWGKWIRPALAFILAVIFLINIQFLFNYVADIWFAPRTVNAPLASATLGARAIIRYDSVIRANDTKPATITVEIDRFAVPASPILVIFRERDIDIVDEGPSERRFDPPSHKEDFAFRLKSDVPYNPFQPATVHRRIDLIFESQAPSKPSETYTADLRVDYYSAAAISAGVSFASFIAFLATLWTNVQRVREAWKFVRRVAKTVGD